MIGTNRAEYFYYNGKFYGTKTKVLLRDDYIDSHEFDGKKLRKEAMFSHKVTNNNIVHYCFQAIRSSWYVLKEEGFKNLEDYYNKCVTYFTIPALEIDDAIEEITNPICPPENVSFKVPGFHEDMTPVRDWEVSSLMIAWAVFIAFLAFSLVLKQWYILWPIAGFVFDKIRNEMLSR